MALCRKHHEEIEHIGPIQFSRKYHVPVDGIKLKLEDLKKLGIKGNYIDEKDTEHDRR